MGLHRWGLLLEGHDMKRQVNPVLKIILIAFCFGLLNLAIAIWFSRSSP